MTRTLSYADAVRLLGGDSEFLDRLKLIGGGVILGAAATFPQFLALLGAEEEIIRIGHGLGRRLRERREGLSRVDRTRRIAAAHTVLVVTAYFEAMAAADLPIRYPDLELTATNRWPSPAGRSSWAPRSCSGCWTPAKRCPS